MIKTNDLKKGDRVRLRNGWFATVMDNRKGVRRCLNVEGYYTEMGDVYSHDIMCRIIPDSDSDTWKPTPGEQYILTSEGFGEMIEYTDAQNKLRETVESF